MLMGVILSSASGMGLVILAIMLDHSSSQRRGSMEKVLGVKVIGTLPMIQNEHFKHTVRTTAVGDHRAGHPRRGRRGLPRDLPQVGMIRTQDG